MTATAQVYLSDEEVNSALREIDTPPRSPALWSLSEMLMETAGTTMGLVKSDDQENRDLGELATVLDRIIKANEVEDARHQRIIRLCRAAQTLCRRVAGERGQTGAQRRRQPEGQSLAVANG